jgi:hypothetical protein
MRKLIVLALLLSGCSSYMNAVYGDSPANADYTACLKANPTSWPKFHACMAERGWVQDPNAPESWPSSYRRTSVTR